jgi:hypothetical protein
MQPTQYVIDTIFPAGGFHLFGGSSGMGKTTLLFQMLYEWDRAQDVFGRYKSHPCEWVYVSGDRSLLETHRTLKRLGLDHWDIPCYAIEDLASRDSGGNIDSDPDIFRVAQMFPNARLIVLEGLQGFLPDTKRGQSQNKAEQIFMMRVRDQILENGTTIIATTHTAKNVGEMPNKRNGFLGSAALIGACSTCVAFDIPPEYHKPGMNKQLLHEVRERRVTLMGRDFPDVNLNFSRGENGSFVLESSITNGEVRAEQTPDDSEAQLEIFFIAAPYNTPITHVDIKLWAMKAKATERVMYKWLKGKIQSGELQQLAGRGKYQRIRTQ